jgi:hypothetical protein
MLNARDQRTPSASNCHSRRLTLACTPADNIGTNTEPDQNARM